MQILNLNVLTKKYNEKINNKFLQNIKFNNFSKIKKITNSNKIKSIFLIIIKNKIRKNKFTDKIKLL